MNIYRNDLYHHHLCTGRVQTLQIMENELVDGMTHLVLSHCWLIQRHLPVLTQRMTRSLCQQLHVSTHLLGRSHELLLILFLLLELFEFYGSSVFDHFVVVCFCCCCSLFLVCFLRTTCLSSVRKISAG